MKVLPKTDNNANQAQAKHYKGDGATKLEKETGMFPPDIEIDGRTYSFYCTTSFPQLANSLSSEFPKNIIQVKRKLGSVSTISLFYDPSKVNEDEMTQAYDRAIGKVSSRP